MSRIHFQDRNQNFWQLASIQAAALGIPDIIVAGQLAQTYGPGTAFCSVFLGNLLLWLISLSIITMAEHHENAFENVGNYLGKFSKYLTVALISVAFLTWFTVQSKAASGVIEHHFGLATREEIRFGAIAGIVTSILAMGGIRLIKWFNVVSLPLLFGFVIYALFKSHPPSYSNYSPGVSVIATLTVTALNLPGIVNMPTFFRHSKSKAHSYLGLGVMTILVTLYQSFGIWLHTTSIGDFVSIGVRPELMLGFIMLSLICINIVNIYLASGAWEVVAKRAGGPKDYALFGLLGTGAFALLQSAKIMSFLENLTNSFVASLSIVLLFAFLIQIMLAHRPRTLEKAVGNACWYTGCFAALISLVRFPQNPTQSLVVGIITTGFAFLLVMFLEETIWSIRKSLSKD